MQSVSSCLRVEPFAVLFWALGISVADPELLPGSGIIVPYPDPAKSERAYKLNYEFYTVCTVQ